MDGLRATVSWLVRNCKQGVIGIGEASHIDFAHEKSYGRSSGDPPPPPPPPSPTFFDFAEAPVALFIGRR